MKESTAINAQVWENLYHDGKSFLLYPDNVLVSITHKLLIVEENKHILDYGFGSGSNMLYLLRRGFTVSGVEIAESAIKLVSERVSNEGYGADLKLIRNGIIPFGDNSFDAVIAWGVLCFNDWTSLLIAVKEINRVLRKGGIFLGTMTAPDDISYKTGISLGNHIYESTCAGQTGAIRLIVPEEKLPDCFPGENISIGRFGFEFQDAYSWHWIISYKKQ
jgi:SAM-dependent methyltransferase